MIEVQAIELLYGAPWPYSLYAGIGLQFSCERINKSALIEVMMGSGCPLERALAICSELEETGESKATISANIPLSYLIHHIKEAGVVVQVIPPAQKYIDRAATLGEIQNGF